MNIVLFGSSEFAVPSLKALLTTGHKISCVVTQPDRQKGRGLDLQGTAVKTVALKSNLKIYQPIHVNTAEAIKLLKNLEPDLFVVISYGQILSKEILEIPKIFSLNVHASILPKYRGAAPINWAIIKGEKVTGITVIKMTQKMDAGPIILQKSIEIADGDNAVTLEDKLSKLAAELMLESLDLLGKNKYTLIAQDEKKTTFAPKLKKEDGLIHWDKSALDIRNLIKGTLGWPGAFTYCQGKLLKIYRAKVPGFSGSRLPAGQAGVPGTPGAIMEISKEGIVVSCAEGSLIIQELQLEGKRRMTIEEFIAGHKIRPGDSLG